MHTVRHIITGEVQIVTSLDGYPESDFEVIADPPATDGYRWNNSTRAWEQFGPRDWELRLFLTVLLTPMEFLALRQWTPAGTPTPDDLTFMWAREIILTLPRINLDDPNTSAMLQMCVQRGLLTSQRAARILAGLPVL